MGFLTDMKSGFIWTIVLFAIIIILLVPLDQFINLPDFLWFLENKSLLTYLNQYIPFFISTLPIVGMIILILLFWRAKR